jgi:hypothetical protein
MRVNNQAICGWRFDQNHELKIIKFSKAGACTKFAINILNRGVTEKNRLAGGSFEILGCPIDLAGMRCPLWVIPSADQCG